MEETRGKSCSEGWLEQFRKTAAVDVPDKICQQGSKLTSGIKGSRK